MLSLDEVKKMGLSFYEYKEGVYQYEKDYKVTLIENGVVLVENVDWVNWYQEGVYKYTINGKETLVENGKPLVENADFIYQPKEGAYWYIKDGEVFEIKVDS